jgi:uncharacterized membrane protein YeaQ/YmgE (transglycosylase-associated protein family)
MTMLQQIPYWDQIQPIWQQVISNPAYVVMAVNGLIAGWLAGQILGGGGLIRNLIVGVIGSFVGGLLISYKLLALPKAVTDITAMVPGGWGDQILVSTIGAIVVVLVARFLGRG